MDWHGAYSSRQSVYNTFGSKEGLARALTARTAQRYLDGVEAALREHTGLHDQLRFLDEISERDNVELRIIPSAAGWTPAHAGPFVLLEFAKADPVVHLEHHRSSAFLQDDDSVGAFRAARDELERIALSREDSRKLIAEIAAREQVPA